MGISRQISKSTKPKEKKSKKIESSQKKTSLGKQIAIIVLVAVICLGSVISINALQNWQASKSVNNTKTAAEAISYDEITKGQIFNRSNEEYSVLIYDATTVDKDTVTKLTEQYKKDKKMLYKVDTANIINANLISENATPNLGVQDANSFQVKEAPTLLDIKNKEVTAINEGAETIKGLLK